jgi:hypothetical protein
MATVKALVLSGLILFVIVIVHSCDYWEAVNGIN